MLHLLLSRVVQKYLKVVVDYCGMEVALCWHRQPQLHGVEHQHNLKVSGNNFITAIICTFSACMYFCNGYIRLTVSRGNQNLTNSVASDLIL